MWNVDIRDFHAPGAVQAEHTLQTIHEHEQGHPDRKWREDIFRRLPRRFAYKASREYEEKYLFESRRDANLFLLAEQERLQQNPIPLTASDYELEQIAKKHSQEMRQIAMVIPDEVQAVVRLWKLAQQYGVRPPNPYTPNISPTGILRRLWDDQWWHRQLRRAHAKLLEIEAIRWGYVHKQSGLYISDESFNRYQEQQKRNQRILSHLIAENDDMQFFRLEDLIARGMANPKNRRNELMCRIHGFETIANELGHVGEFLTITCPSRMHARQSKSNRPNPKFDGTTPNQAQRYLSQVWARIRAKLKRDNIKVYGFRVAEPHQDGTPHWHILLFADQRHIEPIRQIFQHYALETDGDEEGAKQHRFTHTSIDKSKGSAIGYIAKYISKNIDGHAINQDEDGLDAKQSAQRVTAWASTWGIRQFQQFGGAPVTIWRELRKNKQQTPQGIITQAFEAADTGKWAEFLKILGGAAPLRKDLPIQLDKKESEEPGKYGDPIGKQIIGIIANTTKLKTRVHQWSMTTMKKLQKRFEAAVHELATPYIGEPLGDGADARNLAHRTDLSGEAALEFC